MNIIKPPLLKNGDTIGILATSGCLEDVSSLERGIKFFEDRGFKVKLSSNVYSKNKYLAGSDEERVNSIHSMFLDKSINAIIVLRGGYGALRIIDKIDYNIIRNNPKIFCGYSDITALNAMFLKRSGLVTYSGPMIVSDFGLENPDEFTVDNFFKTLMNDEFEINGTLWGGNLSTLVSLCGLDFIPDFKFDFFIEDLNEPAYKIDRMLTQLKNIEQFRNNIKSLFVGDFLKIDNEDWLYEVLHEFCNGLKIGMITGFPASHSSRKATIPYGYINY